MQQVARHIGKRYYCETMLITCAECENAGSESDTKPKVIASL